jgi:predicted nucleic acid-binding protein
MYLLDTNVISASSPERQSHLDVQKLRLWLAAASDRLFLSSITIAEIETGIAKALRTGATRKAQQLGDWLDITLHLFGERVLPLDLETARVTGRLFDQAVGRGGSPGFEDAAIAATAVQSRLTVLTRNTRHFELMDVAFLNPFEALPTL